MLKRLIFFLILCAGGGNVLSQTEEKEANLKAAFIYNFTKYVEWDSSDRDEFIIGVIGSSAVTGPLNEIAKKNTVNNKKIIVRVYSRPEDIGNCHILFIPEKLGYSLNSVLKNAGKGILTVSEKSGYAKGGTAFNFVIVEDKLKFEANLKAIYSAGLKAGSQLLKLAIIVD